MPLLLLLVATSTLAAWTQAATMSPEQVRSSVKPEHHYFCNYNFPVATVRAILFGGLAAAAQPGQQHGAGDGGRAGGVGGAACAGQPALAGGSQTRPRGLQQRGVLAVPTEAIVGAKQLLPTKSH